MINMLTYEEKTQLGSLQIGMHFSYGGNVYHIDDRTETQPYYMVTPIGRIVHQHGGPQFMKLGKRHPHLLPKSLVVKKVSLTQA